MVGVSSKSVSSSSLPLAPHKLSACTRFCFSHPRFRVRPSTVSSSLSLAVSLPRSTAMAFTLRYVPVSSAGSLPCQSPVSEQLDAASYQHDGERAVALLIVHGSRARHLTSNSLVPQPGPSCRDGSAADGRRLDVRLAMPYRRHDTNRLRRIKLSLKTIEYISTPSRRSRALPQRRYSIWRFSLS